MTNQYDCNLLENEAQNSEIPFLAVQRTHYLLVWNIRTLPTFRSTFQ